MKRFEVGFVSSKWTVEAPSADTAAFYAMFHLAVGFGTSMIVIYTEDGEPFKGDMWWLELALSKEIPPEREEWMMQQVERIKAELPLCKVIPEPEDVRAGGVR